MEHGFFHCAGRLEPIQMNPCIPSECDNLQKNRIFLPSKLNVCKFYEESSGIYNSTVENCETNKECGFLCVMY
jgi:hypothetical protein